jgi:hypothetical protein
MILLEALQRPAKTYDLSVSMTNGMAASPSHTPYSMALRSRHGDRDRTSKGTIRLAPGYSITDADLQEALGSTPLTRGDVCLIRTGWIQQYDDPKSFFGEDTGVAGVGDSAGKWLAAHATAYKYMGCTPSRAY